MNLNFSFLICLFRHEKQFRPCRMHRRSGSQRYLHLLESSGKYSQGKYDESDEIAA